MKPKIRDIFCKVGKVEGKTTIKKLTLFHAMLTQDYQVQVSLSHLEKNKIIKESLAILRGHKPLIQTQLTNESLV